MAGWRFAVADRTGRSIGELRAKNRRLDIAVSRTFTASCTVRTSDPLWDVIAAGDAMLKVYDSGQSLRLYGPIISDEEAAAGQGASVAIAAADLSWDLAKRYLGKDPAGIGRVFTTTDSGEIAHTGLNEINAEAATGVIPGNRDSFITRTITYLWKPYLALLGELGAIAGSYEWELRYVDGTPPTVYLDLLGKLGSNRTASVFLEYGTGSKNCSAYRRLRTIEKRASHVWVLGSGSTIVVNAYDDAAAAARGRAEDVISYGDIGSAALLDALAAAHVAIRKDPRILIQMTPAPKKAPGYGVDWSLGDLVNARAVVANKVRFSGAARIWGASIAIDELGNETPALRLQPDGS